MKALLVCVAAQVIMIYVCCCSVAAKVIPIVFGELSYKFSTLFCSRKLVGD